MYDIQIHTKFSGIIKNIYLRGDKYIDTRYIQTPGDCMIQTIIHKRVRLFFEKGNGSRLPREYLTKIALILDALDAVSSEEDIKALGAGIHRLTGNYAGFWSIKVSPNYRIIFRYVKGDIFELDYVDYN